jgi:hypothetical protein
VREFSYELPCGILHDKQVLRQVILRTATSGDRRIFGDELLVHNSGALVTQLLFAKLVRIDGMRSINEQVIRQLLGPDRDAMVYAIRRETTRSKPFTEKFICSHCETPNEVDIPCSEIEDSLRIMPDDARKTVQNGKCVFTVDLPQYEFKGIFAYTDGLVQEHLGQNYGAGANMFEMEDDILSQLCVDFNGSGGMSADSFATLDMEFKDDLQDAIRKFSYGYETAGLHRCYKCKKETRVRADSLDFFLEGLRQRMRGSQTPSHK